jgi:hypothetical protein
MPQQQRTLSYEKKHYFPPFYSNDRLIEKKNLNMKRRKEKARFQKKTQRHLPYKKRAKKVLGASVLSSKPVEKKAR